MRTNTIRFSGLASGLDTKSMVDAMIMPYKAKVDSSVQSQKLLELKKEAWKEINGKVNLFYTKTLSDARLSGTFNKKDVSISNPGIMEILNASGSPEGTHDVEVTQLASGSKVDIMAAKDLSGNKVSKATKLSELGFKEGDKITITVNKGKADENTKEITVANKSDGTEMTIKDLETEIKSIKGLNVSFDDAAGAFFISSKQTGAKQTLDFKVEDSPTNPTVPPIDKLAQLGFKADTNGEYKYEGKDSIVKYNGLEITSETNKVTINGLEMKLLSEGKTKVVATQDTEAIVDFVKSFVEEYNKLLEEINLRVDAPYNKDYKPLTDEQKESMSEADIKIWEEKINKSILRDDQTLNDVLGTMRNIIGGTSVKDSSGKSISLSSIGITSGLWNEKGKLYIDEDKLRAAVSKDSEAIATLFTKRVNPWDAMGKTKAEYDALTDKKEKALWDKKALVQGGIGVRLYEDMSTRLVQGNKDKSANFLFNDKLLDKQIWDKKDEASALEKKMYEMEDAYYKKFAAMEKMMSQLNSQSSWLAGQLGGM